MKLSNVPFKIGQANGSGIGKKIYFIPAEDIIKWPVIVDNLEDANSPDEYNGYKGDFTLKAKAAWIEVYNTQGEGTLDAKPTGDTDSKLFTNSLKFRFPKLTPESASMANAVVNGDGIFLAWHDGYWRVVGNEFYRTTVTPDFTSGTSAGSSKGVTYTAECADFKALPIYRGLIVISGGVTLDATTGRVKDTDPALDRGLTQEQYTRGIAEAPSATVSEDSLSITTTSGTAKTATVDFEGDNLTEETLVIVSGTGFSCNVQSITANDANADGGKTVTVTFQGTADSTGTLRFVNVADGIDITVELAAEITE